MKRRNLVGERFGLLTVISNGVSNKHQKRTFNCVCDCGKLVNVVAGSLIGGLTKSCGCYCKSGVLTIKHGKTNTSQYNVWACMKQRCYNKKCKNYKNYGAKGVIVCDRWLNDFEAFMSDMGDRPSPKHSIERLDVTGIYSPENCVWADRNQQAKNKRDTIYLTINGQRKPLIDFARENSIHPTVLRYRYHNGWDESKMLTKKYLKTT